MHLTRSRSDVITSVARSAGAAQMLLVRTDKRSVKHITSSAVLFCFHYACHLMLRNVVLAASARILPAGKMVQAIIWFVCVPNRKPRTETVQYEYMYRYTPNIYTPIHMLYIYCNQYLINQKYIRKKIFKINILRPYTLDGNFLNLQSYYSIFHK